MKLALLPILLMLLCTSLFADEIPWLTLHDPARNRDLSMSICIPDADGPRPLVILSHGAYGSAMDVIGIARYWAANGYIVILPTHADSFVYTTRSDENDPWSGPHDFGEYGRPTTQGTWKPIWLERPRDIRFILNSLDNLERRVPGLKGRIDRERIALAGHSLGAYTMMLLAGATVDIPGGEKAVTFLDPRIRALILISPQGQGQQGLTETSWQKLALPMLLITGSYDTGVYDQPPAWRQDAYRLSPPGDKYLLFIEGANHNSFMGHHVEKKGDGRPLQRAGESDEQVGEAIFRDTRVTTLRFLDAYLRNDSAAKRYLIENQIRADSGGRSTMSSR